MLASPALLLAAAGLVAAAPQYDPGTSVPAAGGALTTTLDTGTLSVPTASVPTTSAGLATTSAPSSSLPATSTVGVAGAIHTVQVGQGGLVYVPDTLVANPGDQVIFMFNPKNHTATQSTFADPCQKMAGGFASGFMPTDPSVVGTLSQPMFNITVNDTKPIWVYCGQVGHCEQGMVMAINAPATGNTFAAFQAAAMASTATVASNTTMTNSTSNSTGTNTTTTGSSSSGSVSYTTSSAAGLAVAVVLSFFTLF